MVMENVTGLAESMEGDGDDDGDRDSDYAPAAWNPLFFKALKLTLGEFILMGLTIILAMFMFSNILRQLKNEKIN